MSILVLTSDTLIGTPATGQLEYNGQFYGTDSNAARAQMERISLSTFQNSTSGTAIEFLNVPAWAKRITVIFNAVSTGGTANFQIQSGSGSYEITGYSSGSVYLNTSGVPTAIITTGFVMNYSTFASSTTTLTGHYVLTNLTGNTWVGSHILIGGTNGASISGSGVKSFSGVIDRLRIIGSATGNPADTFDAGQINILYEG
jgi:hypothetical protein